MESMAIFLQYKNTFVKGRIFEQKNSPDKKGQPKTFSFTHVRITKRIDYINRL